MKRVASAAVSRAVHTRGADGHARYRQSYGPLTLSKQALNVRGRHMALDRVALHQRRMTGREFRRHAGPDPGGIVSLVIGSHGKAVHFQMRDPVFAAAAAGILPHLYGHGPGRGPTGHR